jgi:DNA-binding MarR family transcriptional regulator
MAKSARNHAQEKHTKGGKAFEALIFEIFRTYNQINTVGDDLSKEFGLTAARWRVLGSACRGPKTASAIARERGLTRQSVQQIVNSLIDDGLVELLENANHRSAKLVVPTSAARTAVRRLYDKSIGWQNHVAEAASTSDIQIAVRTLVQLRNRLEKKYR